MESRILRHETITVSEWCAEFNNAVNNGDKALIMSLLDYLDHELKLLMYAQKQCPDVISKLIAHIKYVVHYCMEHEPWWNKPSCMKLQEEVNKFPQEEKPWAEFPINPDELLKKLSDVLGFLYVKP